MMKTVICVVGPTASGKTALSVALSRLLDGEIVSFDSMQLYKRMNIGTAKPSEEEKNGIVHHMIDVFEPWESVSAARYAALAQECVRDIIGRGKTAVAVGGTGLYLDALLGSRRFDPVPDTSDARRELKAFLDRNGADALYRQLAEVDPERARKLHVNDVKRVMRALEVYRSTGMTATEADNIAASLPPAFGSVKLGLMPEPREYLYSRIDERVDNMLSEGLEREARELFDGALLSDTASQAIGYKEFFGYFRGDTTYDAAVESIKRESRRYAKRQSTWFRRDQSIKWIKYGQSINFNGILQISADYLKQCGIII